MRMVFLLLLLIVVKVNAQTGFSVSGKIVLPDNEDNEDLDHSLVLILKDSTGTIIGGTVDSNLSFVFNSIMNGNYILSIDTRNITNVKYPLTKINVTDHAVENITLDVEPICEDISRCRHLILFNCTKIVYYTLVQ